jgi:hypothetical protein
LDPPSQLPMVWNATVANAASRDCQPTVVMRNSLDSP